jgi:hypothetical protein
MQDVRLDPERVTGLADPHPAAAVKLYGLTGTALGDQRSGGGGLARLGSGQAPHLVRLRSLLVSLAEGEAVGQVLEGITVRIDLELVRALRVQASENVVAGERLLNDPRA